MLNDERLRLPPGSPMPQWYLRLSDRERLLLDASPSLNRLGGLCSAVQRLTHTIDGRVPTSRRTLMIAQCEGRDYFQELRDRRASHVAELVERGASLIEMGLSVKRLPEFKAWASGDFTSLEKRAMPGLRRPA